MPWVIRDGDGSVKGICANRQPGLADEELPTDHADIAAYQAKKAASRAAPRTSKLEQALLDAFQALVDKGVVSKGELPKELTDRRRP
jgi:hypothetical protein